MLVNLGAGVDVVSSELGRRFVAINGKYVSLRLTGERVDLPIGKVVTLAIGGVSLDAPHVGIWSGLDGTGIDGLIAATAFRNSHNHIRFPQSSDRVSKMLRRSRNAFAPTRKFR